MSYSDWFYYAGMTSLTRVARPPTQTEVVWLRYWHSLCYMVCINPLMLWPFNTTKCGWYIYVCVCVCMFVCVCVYNKKNVVKLYKSINAYSSHVVSLNEGTVSCLCINTLDCEILHILATFSDQLTHIKQKKKSQLSVGYRHFFHFSHTR